MKTKNDNLILGDLELESRLILGTGKFASSETMLEAVRASKTQLVTVALRRFNREQSSDDLYSPLTKLHNLNLMPNTSGARTAEEALRAALLGREISGTNIVKLEIHPNPHHLMPDPIETLKAADLLVAEDFDVMPYMPADPVLAKRLEDCGCLSLMPLGSAIGSGRGLANREMIKLIIEQSKIPVIVDAGLRAPSEAAAAMEMGCDAVLVNSAVAASEDPIAMASAFAQAVLAGRQAYNAGLMSSGQASSTSPLTEFLA